MGTGVLIGANELWIAATALAHRMPLVTGDVRHYSRVPELSLRAYRKDQPDLLTESLGERP